MKRIMLASGIALATGLLLVAGATPLRAEDSNVFKNGSGILQAQEILVGDGYLAKDSFAPGIMDEPTQKALSEYQSSHALNDNGVLDDDTFEMLTSHGTSFPWGGELQVAAAEPLPAEPAPAPQVAEAPPVPKPTPASAEVREAPVPAAPAVSAEPARKMPATGSSLPLLALSGLALVGGGALLLRQRAA